VRGWRKFDTLGYFSFFGYLFWNCLESVEHALNKVWTRWIRWPSAAHCSTADPAPSPASRCVRAEAGNSEIEIETMKHMKHNSHHFTSFHIISHGAPCSIMFMDANDERCSWYLKHDTWRTFGKLVQHAFLKALSVARWGSGHDTQIWTRGRGSRIQSFCESWSIADVFRASNTCKMRCCAALCFHMSLSERQSWAPYDIRMLLHRWIIITGQCKTACRATMPLWVRRPILLCHFRCLQGSYITVIFHWAKVMWRQNLLRTSRIVSKRWAQRAQWSGISGCVLKCFPLLPLFQLP
jgi:hypothetical protein